MISPFFCNHFVDNICRNRYCHFEVCMINVTYNVKEKKGIDGKPETF